MSVTRWSQRRSAARQDSRNAPRLGEPDIVRCGCLTVQKTACHDPTVSSLPHVCPHTRGLPNRSVPDHGSTHRVVPSRGTVVLRGISQIIGNMLFRDSFRPGPRPWPPSDMKCGIPAIWTTVFPMLHPGGTSKFGSSCRGSRQWNRRMARSSSQPKSQTSRSALLLPRPSTG